MEDKEKIIKICDHYDWTEEEYINQLLNRANLTPSERQLFKLYAIDCNGFYLKLARLLNSSKYLVTKEIKAIRKKIINTHNKF
jgi:hypothetical protein